MAGIFNVVKGLRDRISEERDEVADVPVAKLYPHVPNLVTFVDHSKPMPWTKTIPGVLMFADISGFTALCEKYSSMSTAGIDKLTRTLNEYLGSLVEIIIQSKGDVLKFAGDAILALWRTSVDEVREVVETVVKCCVDIQEKCGLYETDIGVTLTVKMGVAAGDITLSFVGNDVFRHYVESGSAVDDVKLAEKQCQSGYIVLSPGAWRHCRMAKFIHVFMPDDKHIRVMSLNEEFDEFDGLIRVGASALERGRRHSLVTERVSERRGSLALVGTSLLGFGRRRQSLHIGPVPSLKQLEETQEAPPAETEESEPVEMEKSPLRRRDSMSKLREATRILGDMPKKLRLYVLSPVLNKLDDGQPLEYLSEMRQISVIFMNLSLEESADISCLMQNLFEIVYKHVQRLQGCLNKIFLFDKGCSFLVIFGLPGYKHEQDCAYALQCSVGMFDSLQEQNDISEVSIGVTTGTAFCGVVGHEMRHEYSVIGRKVNMAARLMMYYPGAITCDDETFQGSRLPPQAFDVVPSKAMKGLQNIGTLRQFVAPGNVDVAQIHALKHFLYPLLGREQEMDIFKQLLLEKKCPSKDQAQKQMIVLEAGAGMGKTRLLDAIASTAPDLGARVVSCALFMDDVNKPYFLAQLLLRMLLTNAGFSEKLEGEEYILEELQNNHLVKYLPVLKLIMGHESSYLQDKASKDKTEWSAALHKLVNCIVKTIVTPVASHMLELSFLGGEYMTSLRKTGITLFAIDDIHFADTESWGLLADMQNQDNAVFVVTMKPPQMNQKLPEGCKCILAHGSTQKLSLEGLDTKYMCALACQILDVVRIPKAIDRILVEKSHGVPSWCEQLLQDMCSKNILQIVDNDGSNEAYIESTVGPSRNQILISGPEVNNERSTGDFRIPSNQTLGRGEQNLKFPGSTDADVSASMMFLLTTSVSEKICILNPDLNPEDLKIPESVKDMMIARLDALRASEQMLVKCASVLGVCFFKEILLKVLPNRVKEHRVDIRIVNLMKLGIFACGGLPASQDLSTPSQVCECKNKSDDKGKKVLCSILRFQNPMLRETVYGTLLANQRVNLHLKAANQLEVMANKYREKLPSYILERDFITQDSSDSPHVGQKATVLTPDRSDQDQQLWIGVDDLDGTLPNIDVPLRLNVDTGKLLSSDERNKVLRTLMPIYSMISHHWRSAGEMYRLVRTLIEDTVAAIALEHPLRADSLLQDAKAAFVDFQNTDKTQYAYRPGDKLVTACLGAKLERLQGKVNEEENFTQEARMNYIKALRLVGKRQPLGKRAVKMTLSWKLNCNQSNLRCQTCVRQSRRELTEKISEQLYCLNSLYHVHKLMGMDKDALLNALQQLSRTRSYHCNQHQVITAYTAIIEQCRRQKWFSMASTMEQELFTRLKELDTEKQTGYDLKLLAGIYGESSVQALTLGAVHEALLSGIFSAKISRTVELPQTVVRYIPSLVQSQLMALKVSSCTDSLSQLKEASKELDDKVYMAWFYCCCLDLILDAGQPTETFQQCMMFICWLFSNPGSIANNAEDYCLNNYLFMRFAVWNCRKRSFLEADRWYQIALDSSPNDLNNFFALQSQARHIECLLLTLCQAKKGKLQDVEEKILKSVSKELSYMRSGLKWVPSLRPRFLHLLAYFYAQSKNWKRCQQEVDECCKQSLRQGNAYERKWAQYNWRQWTGAMKATGFRDSIWLSYSDGHVFDWRVTDHVCDEVEFYPWPVPSKMVGAHRS